MNILGINAYHGDAAACLVIEGKLVAAIEEERFTRIKHWAGFPAESIRWCLDTAGVRLGDLDHVAVGRNPSSHLPRKLLYTLMKRPGLAFLKDRGHNRRRVLDLGQTLWEAMGAEHAKLRARVHFVEHHCAHVASSFFVSPFDEAACVSVDGFGDFVSTMLARGRGSRITVDRVVPFPHSLGAFYTAGSQYLGFPCFGDEYKVMGLAAYGEATHLDTLREIVRTRDDGLFRLDTAWFRHPREVVDVQWDAGTPELGAYFSERWAEAFGPPRVPGAPLEDRHRDLARSLQARLEEVYLHLLLAAAKGAGSDALCLSGGCAYNSVANGLALDRTPFARLYVPPAAGDAGTAVGAAYWVHHQVLGRPRTFLLDRAALGPEFPPERIRRAVDVAGVSVRWIDDESARVAATAERLVAGDVVGWFQGREEWGPRALGQRSILADPRRPGMKDVLNERIKRRESFRPFAPSILTDRLSDYFDDAHATPFMTQTYRVKPGRRAEIPAVTHVDGSARPQTVTREASPLFWSLLGEFDRRTGTPVLLNTSFNENEPIVHSPEDAVACFLRTRMDALVIGSALVTRRPETA